MRYEYAREVLSSGLKRYEDLLVKANSTTILFRALVFSILTVTIVAGQKPKVGGEGGTIKVPATRSNKPTIKTVVVKERVTPTTGSLSVAAPANTTIVVEPSKPTKGQSQLGGKVPPGEGVFVFNDLKPGRYRVAGTLAGHHEVETEIVIAANHSQSLTLDFHPVLYQVIINTNINTGELKYGLEGEALSNVKPIVNRSVELNVPEGKYIIEIVPAEFGYETLRHAFSPSDNKTVLELPLKRIVLTTDTLSPKWTDKELQAWDMPVAWRPDSQNNLLVSGPGVAVPREESLRYYKDFRLSSSAKMLSGVALSFALRAHDSKNYYLLQLTGEKSDEPSMVRLFVVKNGLDQRIRVLPIPKSSAKAMQPGQFFGVSIKMMDYEITVEIEDSQTGATYLLGVLTDPNHTFPVGAVGIAGRNNEENIVGRFVVCTGDKCLSNSN